jgi:hypothetical protein
MKTKEFSRREFVFLSRWPIAMTSFRGFSSSLLSRLGNATFNTVLCHLTLHKYHSLVSVIKCTNMHKPWNSSTPCGFLASIGLEKKLGGGGVKKFVQVLTQHESDLASPKYYENRQYEGIFVWRFVLKLQIRDPSNGSPNRSLSECYFLQ